MSDSTGVMGAEPAEEPTILGHPKGLVILFFVEMWERFSYYGMRALLIFYLTQHFLFSDQESGLTYGAYTALVYMMPVIGGVLADRYLGAKKAVTIGALLLVCGHFGMAFEGEKAEQFLTYDGERYEVLVEGRGDNSKRYLIVENEHYSFNYDGDGNIAFPDAAPANLTSGIDMEQAEITTERDQFFLQIFYLSLALIIAGVGFLKANISTIVGALYDKGDIRRDSGFTIFYMGINLGAAIAPILCGILGQIYGWAYGFGLAGIGMLAGLVVFLRGQPLLKGKAEPPDPAMLKEKVFAGISREVLVTATAIPLIFVAWLLVQNHGAVNTMFIVFGGGLLLTIIAYSLVKCDREERQMMWVATFLILCQIPFWALFEQTGSSLNLLTDRIADRVIFGWEVPASVFQSVNAAFIVTLAPVFAILWIKLANRGWEPNTPIKFAIGLVLVGVGFLVLVGGIGGTAGTELKIALIWVILLYLIHTMGELCLSPVGLSMITKLSVPKLVGMMMGGWFLATGYSNYLAGLIAAQAGAETIGGELTDVVAAKANYMDVYSSVGWMAIACGVVVFLISPVLKKGMHGVH